MWLVICVAWGKEQWSFIHIPKCAGASVVTELRQLDVDIYPKSLASHEHGSLYDRKQRPNYKHLAILRSPRDHVTSQYAECRFSGWGQSVTRGTDFPRNGTFEDDFKTWLLADKDFKCYHPRNMQTRYLSSTRSEPHSFEPANLSLALDQLRTMDWVGLVEFFHPSFCVLVMRANASLDECNCQPHDVTNIRHYKGGHPIITDPEILEIIDNVTDLDRQLVSAAIPIVFNFIQEMEQKIGRKVLCDTTTSLDYLHPTISELYPI